MSNLNSAVVDDEHKRVVVGNDEYFQDDIVVYPYLHGTSYPFDEYDYDHLVDFSKRSIEKYNKDEGRKFEFVELMQGLLFSTYGCDNVTAHFKASEPDNCKIMTFKAYITCRWDDDSSPSLEDSSPRWVSPLPDSEAQDVEKRLQGIQEKILSSLLDRMGDDEMDDDEMDDRINFESEEWNTFAKLHT